MSYSQPYIILVCLLIMLSAFEVFVKFDKKSIQTLNYITGISFILFFGFRGFIGWDWYNYYPFFKEIPVITDFGNYDSHFEIGFCILTSLVKSISTDYNFYIFVNTVIDFILLHVFFKRYLPNYLYTLAFVAFIVMEGLVVEINLLRNIKGLLLFLLSLKYIENRSLLKFVLLNIIGMTFHWSSVIFLPLYFFLHKKIELRIYFIIFIVGIFIYLFQFEFAKPIVLFVSSLMGETAKSRAEMYLSNSIFSHQYGITIGFIERIGTSILIMIYYNKLIDKSKLNILFINSFILFIVFYLYFSEFSIIVTRIGNLFFFSYWILWPLIIDTSTNVTKYLIFIIINIYMNVRILKATDQILFKYDNVIFGKHQSYSERVKVFNKHATKIQKEIKK